MSGSGTEVGGVTLSLTVTKITLKGLLCDEVRSDCAHQGLPV